MKTILFLSLMCFTFAANAQKSTIKDSTVTLNEVKVKASKKQKKKLVNVDLEGFPAYSQLQGISKIVSLVQNIPDGQIVSVLFHFNSGLPNLFKKKLNIAYKDVELGILVYEVGTDGKPGAVLSENEVKFVVKQDHHGTLKIDLHSLHLHQKNIYIGFQVLSDIDKKTGNISVRFSEKKKAKSYFISAVYGSGKWCNYFSEVPSHLKLTLGVEQIK